MELIIYHTAMLFGFFCLYKLYHINDVIALTNIKTELKLKQNFVKSYRRLPSDIQPELELNSSWLKNSLAFASTYPMLLSIEILFIAWVIIGSFFTDKWFYFISLFIIMKAYRIFYRDIIYYNFNKGKATFITLLFIIFELVFVYFVYNSSPIWFSNLTLQELINSLHYK
jgi:hypothetical protein